MSEISASTSAETIVPPSKETTPEAPPETPLGDDSDDSDDSDDTDDTDDEPEIPDTVDPPVRSKDLDPLLRPRRRRYTDEEFQEIFKLTSLHTIPHTFMPIDTRRPIWQPPVMLYGWEVNVDKIVALAKQHGLAETQWTTCDRSELEGRDIDPTNVSEDPLWPGMVRVRSLSPAWTVVNVFDWYLNEFKLERCVMSPVRLAIHPDGTTTRIFAFYSNYHHKHAPSRAQLKQLEWVMDEHGIGGELKWWFSAMDADWRGPNEEWPHR